MSTSAQSTALSSPAQPSNSRRVMEHLGSLAWSFVPAVLVQAAIRNGIFDALEQGPLTVHAISEQTGCSLRGLTPVLNMLASIGLLARDAETRFALTDESRLLLTNNPGGFAGIFRHSVERLLPRYLHMSEVVRRGAPAGADDGQFFEEFVEDLFPLTYPAAQAVGQMLGVPDATRELFVLDLGAGSGVWGVALAHQSHLVRVTAVDDPKVLRVTRDIAERHGVHERFRYVPGDLLALDCGSGYDIATIGHVLHCLSAEQNQKFLRSVYEVVRPGATVVISEMLVDQDRSGPPFGLLCSVNMLVNTEGGDAYSFGEIRGWLEAAGFVNVRQQEAPPPASLIFAEKP